jgi:hypothetical protein
MLGSSGAGQGFGGSRGPITQGQAEMTKVHTSPACGAGGWRSPLLNSQCFSLVSLCEIRNRLNEAADDDSESYACAAFSWNVRWQGNGISAR